MKANAQPLGHAPSQNKSYNSMFKLLVMSEPNKDNGMSRVIKTAEKTRCYLLFYRNSSSGEANLKTFGDAQVFEQR